MEARDPTGLLLRQGSRTVDLSESPIQASVRLEAVAHQPPALSLTLPAQVEKGQEVVLRVAAQDPNPEAAGVALRRLWVDWGDGSQAEEALSGRSA